MNSWKSDEVIEITMHWIHNNLILKRDLKIKAVQDIFTAEAKVNERNT